MTQMLSKSDIDNMTKDELEKYIHDEDIVINQLDNKQLGIKTLMNTVYGCTATKYFILSSVVCAESITLTGQTTTGESFKMFNDYLNKVLEKEDDNVIFSDTDSAAINFTEFVDKIIGKEKPFEEKLNKLVKLSDVFFGDMLQKTFDNFAIELNSMHNNIVMKREKVAKAIIVAKKNYIVDVYDNEGVRYAKPKLSVTGMEAVKALTPNAFRDALMKGYKICLDNTEQDFQSFIASLEASLDDIPLDDLFGTTTVNKIEEYSDKHGNPIKGCPGHVKGALAYNKLVEGNEKYTPIQSGDKVYAVNLKEPNPIHSETLAFVDKFPSDLIGTEYIDRKKVYKKYFEPAIKRVSDTIGYSLKPTVELGLF